MNLLSFVYMFLGLMILFSMGCVSIYGIGIVMNFISDKHKKFEWFNTVLAIIAIFVTFIILASGTMLIMLLMPAMLLVIFIFMIIAIIEYFI